MTVVVLLRRSRRKEIKWLYEKIFKFSWKEPDYCQTYFEVNNFVRYVTKFFFVFHIQGSLINNSTSTRPRSTNLSTSFTVVPRSIFQTLQNATAPQFISPFACPLRASDSPTREALSQKFVSPTATLAFGSQLAPKRRPSSSEGGYNWRAACQTWRTSGSEWGHNCEATRANMVTIKTGGRICLSRNTLYDGGYQIMREDITRATRINVTAI